MTISDAPGSASAAGRSDRKATLIAAVAGGSVTGVAVLLILLAPGVEPVWDQTFIAYSLTSGYPHFESGIVSHLLVGVVNALVSYDPVSSNTLIRALAALLYLGSATLLAWSVTGRKRWWGFLVFVLLLATARFPFLWLSSELFAGAFLMLFLWSLVREHPFPITALFLVLFGLSKADLALPALLVGVYLVLRNHPVPRWRRAAILGGMIAFLVVPSLFTPSYYAQFGGRTRVSFAQHYAVLVQPLQVESAPPGWTSSRRYFEASFPGASTVSDVVVRYPRKYLYFTSLSVAESGIRLFLARTLFLIPIAAFFILRMPKPWRVTVLLLLVSLIPIILLSFLHVRYQARFYPLALFVIFAGLGAKSPGRRPELALAGLLAALLLWQSVDLVQILPSTHWLPD